MSRFSRPRKGPGPLIEREAQAEQPEAVGMATEPGRDIGEKARVERVGPGKAPERGFREHDASDVPDILVDASVPDDAENVPVEIVSQVLEEADVAAELEDVLAEGVHEVGVPEMGGELLPGLEREPVGPRDIGRLPSRKDNPHDFALLHLSSTRK